MKVWSAKLIKTSLTSLLKQSLKNLRQSWEHLILNVLHSIKMYFIF